MAKCPNAPGINEGHMKALNSHGYWYCEYGCGWRKKAAKAEDTKQTIDRLGQRSSPLDNKAGCAGAFIGLAALGGGLLYALFEAAKGLIV
jgi:hypothetical protein